MAPQHSDLVRLLPLTTRLSIVNYPHRNIKMSDHWRMELNNYLQRSHGTRVLKWEHTHIGPQNDLTWTAYAFINGLER
ncbi:hypothetical protein A0H81_11595 [Grifola frondosa]|uniref:Uncharacterized protein n=1 Tax=Grifola frondosa TaxID=5627 RepID=A0A1C7LV69_GRIFR|nr:hypothetical protein A0H81_11595 [Grifola frondosa]